ncbi:MAG TPA: twin-arginine translocase TatA/TatE family subunit [Gammaproteobacteria bacterium]|nr:twin-arginine translocase TatA/TatE family subunit [Gammaproteobacteria bacterium]
MGLGGISMWQLLIVLLIVVLIFGTKRLKTIGGDLGGALKSFRKAMDSGDDKDSDAHAEPKRIEDGKPDAEFAEEKDKTQSS